MAYIAVPSSSSERRHPLENSDSDDSPRRERTKKRARCGSRQKFHQDELQDHVAKEETGLVAKETRSARRARRASKKAKKARKAAKRAKKLAKKAKSKTLASSGTTCCSGADIEVPSSPRALSDESCAESGTIRADALSALQEGSMVSAMGSQINMQEADSVVAVNSVGLSRHQALQVAAQAVPQEAMHHAPAQSRAQPIPRSSVSESATPPRLSELRRALATSGHVQNSFMPRHITSVDTAAPASTQRLLGPDDSATSGSVTRPTSTWHPTSTGSVLLEISEGAEKALRLAGQAAAELGVEGSAFAKASTRFAQAAKPECVSQSRPQVPPLIPTDGPFSVQRRSLPVFAHRNGFLETLRNHKVVVVEGDTGCGKSTQLPQYVLEEASANQQSCNIIVTQPRRISAIGVAERVAEECSTRCGETVGYAIRLETSSSPATRLLFCTVGIMLRRLESDPELRGLTHIFVDEVHERSVEIDLLLLALSDIRFKRPELWVVLMSATLESDLLSKYFDGAPRFRIPGRTFSVKTLFLEDALAMTSHVVERYADWATRIRTSNRRYCREVGYSGATAHSPGERGEDLSEGVVRDRYYKYSIGVQKALSSLDPGAVNYELAAQVIEHFLKSPAPVGQNGEEMGAILVFLSGAKEIQTMRTALLAAIPALSREPDCSWILTLHSSLPPEQQRLAFAKPPEGVRKIVLATNIAETSITIDDVGVVVDTCHVKELRYDTQKRLASLEDVIVSRASIRQRRGRAGRVGPGTCVHLITKYCHDHLLEAHQLAEVQRVPLEQLVLRVHATGLHQGVGAEAACARLLQPPDKRAVMHSVKELVDLGALANATADDSEELTCLGRLLTDLPVDARMGKLVLLGVAFGRCVFDAILTVAATLTVGSPLAWSWDHKYEAQRAHRGFAEKLIVGDLSCSDVLAMLKAYQEWDRLQHRERAEFCRANFLRPSVLFDIAKMKKQLHDILLDSGLLNWQPDKGRKLFSGTSLAPLIIGLLCAALFPKLVLVVPRESLLAQMGGHERCYPVDLFVEDPGSRCRDSSRASLAAVQVHPSSVSAREKFFGTPYLIYSKLVQTARLYVYDVTPVPPLTLAVFAGALSRGLVRLDRCHAEGHDVLAIGSSVRFAMPPCVCKVVLEIRAALDGLWRVKLERAGRSRHDMHNPPSDVSIASFLEHLSQLLSMPVA